MNSNNYIVFDVETGGLDPFKSHITQIGMIALSPDLKVIGTYESMIGQYAGLNKYDAKALKVTGFTLAQIEDSPSALYVFQEVLDFIKLYIPKTKSDYPILVGQNVEFDMGFLTVFFDHFKHDLRDYVFNTYIDTLALSKLKFALDKSVSQYNLTALSNKFHISLTEAHSALPDVEATAEIFIQMAHLLRVNEKPNSEKSLNPRSNYFQI